MPVAAAILWAQWRTLRNRRGLGGSLWSTLSGSIWYGAWALAAMLLGKIVSEESNTQVIHSILPATLLMITLYWQVIPLLMATTGASLEMRKLRPYPIPDGQLFWIEAMLRATAGIEMILLLFGIAVGAPVNPAYPKWAPAGLLAFIVFNLFLAIGMRDLVARLVANRRVREAGFVFLAMGVALPQLILTRRVPGTMRMLGALGGESWRGWPWTAAARLLEGDHSPIILAVMAFWILWAGLFGRWQFSRSLKFDADTAASSAPSVARSGLMERFYRLPSTLLPDPLGVLVEKEFRTLTRSSRFRVVFLMGFTFGLMIWLPMALGYGGHRHGLAQGTGSLPFMARNYLTVVSVYSLLLLSESCFWNSFGFDRSAAQFYFLAPVPFRTVLLAKNIASLFFIAAEISAVAFVCVALGLPVGSQKLIEAIVVAAVMSLFLLSAGNIHSIRNARGVNPANSFRTVAAGRIQATLFLLYPLIFSPIALAFYARYAFDSEFAFFAVLAVDAAMGAVTYLISMRSAVESAEGTKESMIAALSTADGPIAA
jgi:ABC-2 type transport system permease protein